MKKVLFVLATTLSLAACNKEEKAAENTPVDVAHDTLAQDSTATTVDVAVSVTPDVVSQSQDVTVTD